MGLGPRACVSRGRLHASGRARLGQASPCRAGSAPGAHAAPRSACRFSGLDRGGGRAAAPYLRLASPASDTRREPPPAPLGARLPARRRPTQNQSGVSWVYFLSRPALAAGGDGPWVCRAQVTRCDISNPCDLFSGCPDRRKSPRDTQSPGAPGGKHKIAEKKSGERSGAEKGLKFYPLQIFNPLAAWASPAGWTQGAARPRAAWSSGVLVARVKGLVTCAPMIPGQF